MPAASLPYPSDLSNQEWALLAPLLPPPKPGGRPRSVDLRRICNGVFHVLRSGCQWRLLLLAIAGDDLSERVWELLKSVALP
jgi:transposase